MVKQEGQVKNIASTAHACKAAASSTYLESTASFPVGHPRGWMYDHLILIIYLIYNVTL